MTVFFLEKLKIVLVEPVILRTKTKSTYDLELFIYTCLVILLNNNNVNYNSSSLLRTHNCVPGTMLRFHVYSEKNSVILRF